MALFLIAHLIALHNAQTCVQPLRITVYFNFRELQVQRKLDAALAPLR
jgi:hypothetical protein